MEWERPHPGQHETAPIIKEEERQRCYASKKRKKGRKEGREEAHVDRLLHNGSISRWWSTLQGLSTVLLGR